MAKITLEETKKYHKELWNWLADNPDKHKNDWPEWKHIGTVLNNCLLCHISPYISEDNPINTKCCHVSWGDGMDSCVETGSYYNKWRQSKGPIRSNLAKIIAELEWSE